MGTIAARDAARICTLTERVVSIHLLAAAQACELRGTIRHRPHLETLLGELRKVSPRVTEDRPLDRDIERIAQLIASSDVFRI